MTFRSHLLPLLTVAALLALPSFAQAATSTHGAILVSATVVATCTVSAQPAGTAGAAVDCAHQADFSISYEHGSLAAAADQDPIQTNDGVTEIVTY